MDLGIVPSREVCCKAVECFPAPEGPSLHTGSSPKHIDNSLYIYIYIYIENQKPYPIGAWTLKLLFLAMLRSTYCDRPRILEASGSRTLRVFARDRRAVAKEDDAPNYLQHSICSLSQRENLKHSWICYIWSLRKISNFLFLRGWKTEYELPSISSIPGHTEEVHGISE